jgi:ligand-binding sensor domain-containing protein
MRFPRENMKAVWIRLAARRLMVFASVLACASSMASPAETKRTPEYQNTVRNYGPEDGFSQNDVNALLQGQDGYLWVGTFGGLVRFDGGKFTTLRAIRGTAQRDPTNTGGPGSDRIVALREDADGRIWIGTEDGGLSLYDRGRFQQLPICGGTCGVRALSPQVAGTIWAVTDAGVFRIATDTLRATRIRDQTTGLYNEVAVGNDGRAYLSGAAKRMGMVVGEDIVPVSLPQGVASTEQMIAAGKFVWVVTDMGLYRFDPSRASWTLKRVEPNPTLLESPDGHLWLSAKSGQLLRADPSGELRPFLGLPAMLVKAVWRDRGGVLWIGSGEKGLWSLRASKAMLRDNVDNLLLYGGSGRSVVGDRMGGNWLGFACGGIRHRLEDGTYEAPRVSIVGRNECVVSLLHDTDGHLWVGTTSVGLLRVAEGVKETIPLTSDLLNLQIWQSDDGDYWLAADGHTFKVRKTDAGTFALSQPVAALEGLTVKKMVSARRGGIWFVGNHGVVRLDKDRIVERWTPEQGLSSRFARSLYEDRRGVLWVGTYGGGLNRIENGRIARYDESNGLFDDTVSCILADRRGNLWLGGDRGISVLPKAAQRGDQLETIPFAVSSGSISFELNGGTQSSCYQDAKGHLWFALVKGFAEIDPAKLAEVSTLRPKVHIERVTSAGLKHDLLKPVVLGASVQPLEIEYTAVNLTSPDQLSFRYRMSGIGQKWTDAGSTRSIIFQNVPWGDHVFEVQARNRGGSWSPSATLRISRPIPWYQRQWLWPLVALPALLTLMWRTRERNSPGRHDARLRRITGRSPGEQTSLPASDGYLVRLQEER